MPNRFCRNGCQSRVDSRINTQLRWMEKSLNSGPSGKTILIVDDEFGILEVLEFILRDAGFKVVSAVNGQEALARLEETRPDLAIVDFMMPILDGNGVIKAIRSDKRLRDIPIIL